MADRSRIEPGDRVYQAATDREGIATTHGNLHNTMSGPFSDAQLVGVQWANGTTSNPPHQSLTVIDPEGV